MRRLLNAGLLIVYVSWLFALCRYSPTFTFSDVFPWPKRSYAHPMRGVMSLYPVTPFDFGNVIGWAFHTEVSGAPLCSAGNQLQARSKRRAPCSVMRPMVHWSCAYNA